MTYAFAVLLLCFALSSHVYDLYKKILSQLESIELYTHFKNDTQRNFIQYCLTSISI